MSSETFLQPHFTGKHKIMAHVQAVQGGPLPHFQSHHAKAITHITQGAINSKPFPHIQAVQGGPLPRLAVSGALLLARPAKLVKAAAGGARGGGSQWACEAHIAWQCTACQKQRSLALLAAGAHCTRKAAACIQAAAASSQTSRSTGSLLVGLVLAAAPARLLRLLVIALLEAATCTEGRANRASTPM